MSSELHKMPVLSLDSILGRNFKLQEKIQFVAKSCFLPFVSTVFSKVHEQAYYGEMMHKFRNIFIKYCLVSRISLFPCVSMYNTSCIISRVDHINGLLAGHCALMFLVALSSTAGASFCKAYLIAPCLESFDECLFDSM